MLYDQYFIDDLKERADLVRPQEMNLSRIYLIAILLLAFGVDANSQDATKAVLVDEFGANVVCEDFAGRVDLWTQEVTKFPNEVGYAIVRGPENKLIERMYRRDSIYGQLMWRFAKNPKETRRFVILEGPDSPEIKVQLFRSKVGDSTILSQEAKWDITFPLKNPIAFYKSQDDGGICPAVNERKQFIDLIRANPSLRGHVVIYESSNKEFGKQKKDFIERLQGVSLSRFSFFRSRKYYDAGHYELWLVPSTKK